MKSPTSPKEANDNRRPSKSFTRRGRDASQPPPKKQRGLQTFARGTLGELFDFAALGTGSPETTQPPQRYWKGGGKHPPLCFYVSCFGEGKKRKLIPVGSFLLPRWRRRIRCREPSICGSEELSIGRVQGAAARGKWAPNLSPNIGRRGFCADTVLYFISDDPESSPLFSLLRLGSSDSRKGATTNESFGGEDPF
ncbi:hypothetical protein CDAR_244751 [Caerostris darwini]|uniref:Uncharacterized protein n=1 Tax=Caerostris darwini TaxID=1538125 RepID=A0AAV4MMH6_9ARAC|nr:hypothetical protein CDAR_244751 [Caerostris darwini]